MTNGTARSAQHGYLLHYGMPCAAHRAAHQQLHPTTQLRPTTQYPASPHLNSSTSIPRKAEGL